MTRQEAEQVLARELEANERLLWAGVPRQGFVLRQGDAVLVPFSLLWGGFAIFWETTVLTHGAPWFASLWGIPFVLVGLYLICGRFVVDARRRAATAYALTDHRALIRSGLFSPSVKSAALRGLSEMQLTERGDGSGTITLGPTPPWAHGYAASSWPGSAGQIGPAFELIADVRSVYHQLRAAQAALH